MQFCPSPLIHTASARWCGKSSGREPVLNGFFVERSRHAPGRSHGVNKSSVKLHQYLVKVFSVKTI